MLERKSLSYSQSFEVLDALLFDQKTEIDDFVLSHLKGKDLLNFPGSKQYVTEVPFCKDVRRN